MSSIDSYKQKERLYDYHKHNLVYIGDYIKFADGKAGVALGATLVMIGFFGKKAKANGFDFLSIWDFSLLIGLVPLIISCYFFVWKVLWPRYTKSTDYYMSWGGIGSFKDSEAYLTHIEGVSDDKFLEDMVKQNYSLADVCLKKYKNLRYGFIALTLGVIIETLSWFFGS